MLPYFFLFASEIVEASITIITPILLGKKAILYLVILWSLQFVTAPLQGGYSDNHCRKRSLIFGFIFVFIANILLILGIKVSYIFLILGMILYAIFGNIDVISRAALLDTYKTRNRRILMGASFISQSIAWILIALSLIEINPIYIASFTIIVVALALLISFLFFKDPRDLSKKNYTFHIAKEIKEIIGFFKNPDYRIGIIAFFLLEVAFYIIDIFHDTSNAGKVFSEYTIFFGSGYIFGLALQMLSLKNEKKIILIGNYITLLATCLATITILTSFRGTVVGFCYFLYSVGSGLTISSFYSLYSKQHGLFKEGKLFGVFTSFQTFGLLVPSVLLSCYSFTILEVHLISLFTFLVVILSFSYLFKSKKFKSL